MTTLTDSPVDRLRAATEEVTVLQAVIYVLAVSLTLLTIYYAYNTRWDQTRFSNLFLGLGLALYYLLEAQRGYEPTDEDEVESPPSRMDDLVDRLPLVRAVHRRYARFDPAIALILAVASLLVAGYVEYHFSRLQFDASIEGYTTLDFVVGMVIIVLVTDATRRAFGLMLTSVVILSVAYAFLGPLLPGIFYHSGMDVDQVARHGAIGLTGTYGFILGVGSTWVAIFIMFAGMAKAYGALDYILDVGREIGTSLHSGVVQIAVMSSMIMGSITGSAAANTATTGSFTIPMMKDQGIRNDMAAAIESVASSGGQMLPPIMGVAAFLMADIIGVPYVEIIQAAIIPALLFYFSTGIAVYLVVLKFGWVNENTTAMDWSVFKSGVHFAIPLGVMLYTLVWLRYTPLGAGFYTIVSLVSVMYVRNLVVEGASVSTVASTTKQTIDGFRQGAIEMAPLVGVLGSLGVALVFVTQTGLSQQISLRMVSLAGGVLVILLLIAMVASILFGLGMPTAAAYILVAMLVVPGVTQIGVPDVSAHMFVFYFAMLSAITPPVAVAVAIGSNIAGASFERSCVQALRIGAPGFVIPFAFITNPSLIYWSFPETVVAFPLVLSGTIALVVATIGYDGATAISHPRKAFYVALTAGALFGPFIIQATAAALIVGFVTFSNANRIPSAIVPQLSR